MSGYLVRHGDDVRLVLSTGDVEYGRLDTSRDAGQFDTEITVVLEAESGVLESEPTTFNADHVVSIQKVEAI